MKKHIIRIIIVIILLITEAFADIYFLKYTADIINVGIIKKGIDLSIPFFIDEEYMNLAKKYFDNDSLLDKYYQYINKTNYKEFQKYEIKKYKSIYLLKSNIDKEEAITYIKEIIKPIINLQNLHTKLKVKNLLKQKLDSAKYNKIINNLSIKNAEYIDSLLDDNLKKEILNIIKEESINVDDIVLEQSINKYNQMMFDKLGINIEKSQKEYLKKIFINLIVLVIINFIAQYFAIKILVSISEEICEKLRNKLLNKFLSFNEENTEKVGISNIQNILIADIKKLQFSLPIIIKELIYAPTVIIYGLIVILENTNIKILIYILFSIIISVLITLSFLLIIKSKKKQSQQLENELNLRINNMFNRIGNNKIFYTRKNRRRKNKKNYLKFKEKIYIYK